MSFKLFLKMTRIVNEYNTLSLAQLEVYLSSEKKLENNDSI